MIPANLDPTQEKIYRAALTLQAGNPHRTVSYGELAFQAQLHPSCVVSAIRRLPKKGLSFPFPLVRGRPRFLASSSSRVRVLLGPPAPSPQPEEDLRTIVSGYVREWQARRRKTS